MTSTSGIRLLGHFVGDNEKLKRVTSIEDRLKDGDTSISGQELGEIINVLPDRGVAKLFGVAIRQSPCRDLMFERLFDYVFDVSSEEASTGAPHEGEDESLQDFVMVLSGEKKNNTYESVHPSRNHILKRIIHHAPGLGQVGVNFFRNYMGSESSNYRLAFTITMLGCPELSNDELTSYVLRFPLVQRRKVVCLAATDHRALRLPWVDQMIQQDPYLLQELGTRKTLMSTGLLEQNLENNPSFIDSYTNWDYHEDLYLRLFEETIKSMSADKDPITLSEVFSDWFNKVEISSAAQAKKVLDLLLKYKPCEVHVTGEARRRLKELSARGELDLNTISSTMMSVYVNRKVLQFLDKTEKVKLLQEAVVKKENGWAFDPQLAPHAEILMTANNHTSCHSVLHAVKSLVCKVFDSITPIDFWWTLRTSADLDKPSELEESDHPVYLFKLCIRVMESILQDKYLNTVNVIRDISRSWVKLHLRVAPSLETLGVASESVMKGVDSSTPVVAATINVKAVWEMWMTNAMRISSQVCEKAHNKWAAKRYSQAFLSSSGEDKVEGYYQKYYELMFEELFLAPHAHLREELARCMESLNLGDSDTVLPFLMKQTQRQIGEFVSSVFSKRRSNSDLKRSHVRRLESDVIAAQLPNMLGSRDVERILSDNFDAEVLEPNQSIEEVRAFLRKYSRMHLPLNCVLNWCNFVSKCFKKLDEMKSRVVWTNGRKKRLLQVNLRSVEKVKGDCIESISFQMEGIPVSEVELYKEVWEIYYEIALREDVENAAVHAVTKHTWSEAMSNVLTKALSVRESLFPTLLSLFDKLLALTLESADAASKRVPELWRIIRQRCHSSRGKFIQFHVATYYSNHLPGALAEFGSACRLVLQDEMSRVTEMGPLTLQATWDHWGEKLRNKDPSVRTATHISRLKLGLEGAVWDRATLNSATNILRLTCKRIQNENSIQRHELYSEISSQLDKIMRLTLLPEWLLPGDVAVEHATAHTEALMGLLHADRSRSDSISYRTFPKMAQAVLRTAVNKWSQETFEVARIWLKFAIETYFLEYLRVLGGDKKTEITWDCLVHLTLITPNPLLPEQIVGKDVLDALSKVGVDVDSYECRKILSKQARELFLERDNKSQDFIGAREVKIVQPQSTKRMQPIPVETQMEVLIDTLEVVSGFEQLELEDGKFIPYDGAPLERFERFQRAIGDRWLEVKRLHYFYATVVDALQDEKCPFHHWEYVHRMVTSLSKLPAQMSRHFHQTVVEVGVPKIAQMPQESQETLKMMRIVAKSILMRFKLSSEEAWVVQLGQQTFDAISRGTQDAVRTEDIALVTFLHAQIVPALRHTATTSRTSAVENQLALCRDLLGACPSAIRLPAVQELLFAHRQDQLDPFLLGDVERTFEGRIQRIMDSLGVSSVKELDREEALPFRPRPTLDCRKLSGPQLRGMSRMHIFDAQSSRLTIQGRQDAMDRYTHSPSTTLEEFLTLMQTLQGQLAHEDKTVQGEATRLMERALLGIFANDQKVRLLAHILSPKAVARAKNHHTTIKVLQRVASVFSADKTVGVCGLLLRPGNRSALKVSLHKALVRVVLSLVHRPEATALLLQEWRNGSSVHVDVRSTLLRGCLEYVLGPGEETDATESAWEVLREAAGDGALDPALRVIVVSGAVEEETGIRWRDLDEETGLDFRGLSTAGWFQESFDEPEDVAPSHLSRERFQLLQSALEDGPSAQLTVPRKHTATSAKELLEGSMWHRLAGLLASAMEADNARATELAKQAKELSSANGDAKEQEKADALEVAAEEHMTLAVFSACKLLKLACLMLPLWMHGCSVQGVPLRKEDDVLLTEEQLSLIEQVLLLSPEQDEAEVYQVRETNFTAIPAAEYALTRGCKLYSVFLGQILNVEVHKNMKVLPSNSEAFEKAVEQVAAEHPFALRIRKAFEHQLRVYLDAPLRESAKRKTASVRGRSLRSGIKAGFDHFQARLWSFELFEEPFQEEFRYLRLDAEVESII